MGHEAVEVLERQFLADQITQVLGWCIMGMTPELQKYYEARFDMFASQGWQDLMEDVAKMREATDTVSGLTDLLKLGTRQGELNIMYWLLTLKDVSEETYRQLTVSDDIET